LVIYKAQAAIGCILMEAAFSRGFRFRCSPAKKQRDAPQETGMQAHAKTLPTFLLLALSLCPDIFILSFEGKIAIESGPVGRQLI